MSEEDAPAGDLSPSGLIEGSDQKVRRAIVTLLRAEQAFSKAYIEWTHAPIEIADRRRADLEKAERALTKAQRAASTAQSHVNLK